MNKKNILNYTPLFTLVFLIISQNGTADDNGLISQGITQIGNGLEMASDKACLLFDEVTSSSCSNYCSSASPSNPPPSPTPDPSVPAQLQSQCDSLELQSKTSGWQFLTMSMYTATAALCTIDCATQPGPGPMCQYSGIADVAADILAAQEVESNTGVIVGEAIAAGAVAAGPKIATQLLKSTAGKASSCISAAIYGAIAAAKWVNFRNSCNDIDTTCKCNILPLAGQPASGGCASPTPTPPISMQELKRELKLLSRLSQLLASSPIASAYADQQGLTPKMRSLASLIEKNYKSVFSKMASQAPALAEMVQSSQLNELGSRLHESGGGVARLAEQLFFKSPKEAIHSTFPEIPEETYARIAKLQAAIQDGRIKVKSDAIVGNTPLRGIASISASHTNNLGQTYNFGSQEGSSAASLPYGNRGTGFSNQDLTDTIDVFHGGWSGSIFDIVSSKLKKNQNRIQNLEWSSPMNRSMEGLKPVNKNR